MASMSTSHHGAFARAVFGILALGLAAHAVPAVAEGEPLVLTLGKALELGLANDETLRQAGLAIQSADARVLEAKSAAFPQISLAGSYGRNILKPSFFLPPAFRDAFDAPARVEMGEDNSFTGAATVTQVLWAAGRVSAGLSAAKEYLRAYHYQEMATTDYVRFGVKQAYYGTLLAAEALRIAESALQTTEEAARVARAGFEQGTVSRFDVMRAEVELQNRRAPLVQARNDFDQALMTLRRRCGIEPGREVSLADSLSGVPTTASLDTMLAAMRRGSAEVRALEHLVGARRQFLRIAKAGRYPMLNLSANYAVQSEWSNDALPPDELIGHSATVGVALQIPIFDGFSAKGKISQARADVRSAELDLERTVRDKELAVRQAYLSLENARSALEGREETVRLAEEAYRLALVRLENGLATPLERLDAELALTSARAQLAETRFSAKLALASLELSVGSAGFEGIAGIMGNEEEGND